MPDKQMVLKALQGVVEIFKAQGLGDTEIHQIVELVILKHIVDGEFTEEYLVYANRAINQRDDDKPSGLILL
tara:strand:+ start:1036 stop:1251 length:216 start_codon:yes stop_codon:yes gene_type:complete